GGGQAMQSFSGGSALAITAKSQHQNWAAAWVKAFTSTPSERGLVQAGNVPNTVTLLDEALADPKLAPFAASAKSSWFVPVDPNWSKVEKSLVMQNALVEIVTGKVSVADGAKKLDDRIPSRLNGAGGPRDGRPRDGSPGAAPAAPIARTRAPAGPVRPRPAGPVPAGRAHRAGAARRPGLAAAEDAAAVPAEPHP